MITKEQQKFIREKYMNYTYKAIADTLELPYYVVSSYIKRNLTLKRPDISKAVKKSNQEALNKQNERQYLKGIISDLRHEKMRLQLIIDKLERVKK